MGGCAHSRTPNDSERDIDRLERRAPGASKRRRRVCSGKIPGVGLVLRGVGKCRCLGSGRPQAPVPEKQPKLSADGAARSLPSERQIDESREESIESNLGAAADKPRELAAVDVIWS
jgi:hypothetical protein